MCFFFFKQKTAYEMSIRDWSSDVCSSDLIGENGTVNAHIINDRVAWSGKRDGLRYSLLSAAVIISEAEQPDFEELGQQAPLRRLPSLFRDERQLPSGPGTPPPAQPLLDGMEPDLPATQ